MTKSYLERACPICASVNPVIEVNSKPRAQDLSFDQVRPFWSGLFKEKIFFSYARCAGCGLLYTPTFFTDDQLEELYMNMEPNMDVVPTDALLATQHSYFDAAKQSTVMSGSYLEIGPDIGTIAKLAARENKFDRFWLFEPNRQVHATLAAAVGDNNHVISADMTDLSAVPDASVGLAVMVHVLDHLIDPVAMLQQLRKKLRAGGVLVIVTHNETSFLRHAMGVRWPPFCLQHPEVYNPKSMTCLLKAANFGTIRVERSKNYFPLSLMIRQAAWRFGAKLDKVPLPGVVLGLKLGNIITFAS